MENNSSERKDYETNLVENNNKNDLYHAIGATGINELGILSGYIYTNINKSKQNPYLKLIFAIHNLFDNYAAEDHNNNPRPVIGYNFYGNRKSLNDWDNFALFPIAFSALFLYEDGSYISP